MEDWCLRSLLQPFVVTKEEQFVFKNRSANRAAADLFVELRFLLPGEAEERFLRRPRGLQAQVVPGAVVGVGAALRHQRDLRSARAAAVRAIVAGGDAKFLQRIERD